jgi:hypothetical protein
MLRRSIATRAWLGFIVRDGREGAGRCHMASFDGEVLQEYADRLYFRARVSVLLYALSGCVFGGFIAYLPMVAWYWTNSTNSPPREDSAVLVGILFGAVIFGMIGNARAFRHRLLAQLTLCQMQIERNTRRPESSGSSDA